MILSFDNIIEQIQSIKKSIDLDYNTIETYRTLLNRTDQFIVVSQLIATVQGNIATKQLQITMLQLGLRDT